MKRTIVINLFGGPGIGKSTSAAYIFSRLKMLGVDCEYVSEFAKDKIWEGNDCVFKCQMYISGKQLFKMQRCYGKVDVIVTDSPILTGCMYSDSKSLSDYLVEKFNDRDIENYNFLLVRGGYDYAVNGRRESLEESVELDSRIKSLLDGNNIRYSVVCNDVKSLDIIVDSIYSIFKKKYS